MNGPLAKPHTCVEVTIQCGRCKRSIVLPMEYAGALGRKMSEPTLDGGVITVTGLCGRCREEPAEPTGDGRITGEL